MSGGHSTRLYSPVKNSDVGSKGERVQFPLSVSAAAYGPDTR